MALFIKRMIIWFMFLFVGFNFSGCGKSFYSGSTEAGFAHFPKNKISPQKALELATPYLDYVYKVRKKVLHYYDEAQLKPFDMVILKRKYYYIVRDNRPHKFVNFYIPYAVKINKNTGEITPPDKQTDAATQARRF